MTSYERCQEYIVTLKKKKLESIYVLIGKEAAGARLTV